MSRRRQKTEPTKIAVRCAIYTRKSVAKGLEQEFNSLDAQREACAQYVRAQAHHGWELVPERYDDGGFSGKDLDRPAFQRLMTDIEAGKIDIVVVYKVDRLSRSLLDFAKVMEQLAAAGASFVSVTQNFSTADAIGRLTLNMLMSFAEFEREMISERTRDKIAASRRRGQWTGGPPPLGYEVVDKKLRPVEAEAALVREVFDLYLQHGSTLPVVKQLNSTRRTTKQHTSGSGRVRTGGAWTKQAVLRTLRNPVYVGLIPYGDECFEGQHQGIVARDVFDRVQAMIDRHRGPAEASRNPAYVLRGLVRCGGCGAALTPGSTRRHGREYRYYRCSTRDKQGADACERRPIQADRLEQAVVDQLRSVAHSTPGLARAVRSRLEQKVRERRHALAAEQRHLPAQIAQLAAERGRTTEALVHAGPGARAALEERLTELAIAIETAETRLRDVEVAATRLNDAEIEARWVVEVIAEFDGIWNVMIPENKGRLLRALLRDVTIRPDGEVVVALDPLTFAEVAA